MTKQECNKILAKKFARFTEVEKQQAVFRAYKMERSTAKDWIIEWLNKNYPDKELLAYCDFTYNGLDKVI
jgi:hypothetical protein